jgi:5-methylcytosine-specific restriction endonuclease McrA
LARQGRQSAKVRDRQLKENRDREKERKQIIEKYQLQTKSKNQREKAVLRVLLCREQKKVSAYSDRTITEDMAAIGDNLEIDHIIPKSRGGMDGQTNRLLCFAAENRGKGNQTPKEWMTDAEFKTLEQRFEHLKKLKPAKWELLHKQVKDRDEFIQSALTDAAYASRQVTDWLQEVLYAGQNDGKRRIFATKGAYTAILRRDWGLFYDREDSDASEKNRADHRHHALDAVVIALTGPERIQDLASRWEQRELARAEGKYLDDQELLPPWDTKDQFRAQVIDAVKNLVVSHRPEGRKLGGSLHNDNPYGPVDLNEDLVRRRISVSKLTYNHLKVPDKWDFLRGKLDQAQTIAEQREIRRQMLAIDDVPPGKPGIVRDRWLREELRAWVRSQGLDPDMLCKKVKGMSKKEDNDKKAEMKNLIQSQPNKCIELRGGYPVGKVCLLICRSQTFCCPRSHWDPVSRRMVFDSDQKSIRIYESQNNHHIEIREKKGKWSGHVVTNWEAVERVRKPLKVVKTKSTDATECKIVYKGDASNKRRKTYPGSAINRSEIVEGIKVGPFVMSLSIGEIVHMVHPVKKEPGYFVVFKIDQPHTVHFTPHYDAGKSKDSDRCRAREDIDVPVSGLQNLGCQDGQSPQKVWVGPLGQIKVLLKD